MTSQYKKTNSLHLPSILLVTSGCHFYREDLLKMVAEHSNVWLLLDSEPNWQIPYIVGYTVVNTLDAQMMIDVARNLPDGVKIDGVLCWDEIRMVQTAKLAQALGLRLEDPENVSRKIVEINARLGGDMIPYVDWVASGINLGQVAVAVACGHKPSVERTHKSVAAIHFLYPENDAIVDSVQINHAALPASVDVAAPLVSPGQQLLLPPADHVSCRYAYVIVHGDTAENCTATTELAVQAFTLKTRHLSTVGGLS